ncbi:MAG: hypothetical protein HYY84_05435 [Deltaproteobacteria bacterium]|nr:hypothetical protein [Deltaproteobacteria bacterium]
MKRTHVYALLAATTLPFTGCKKDETPAARPGPARVGVDVPRAGASDARRPDVTPPRALTGGDTNAPFVTGGGGKRVPVGYETTFTGPKGPVTITYTQLSGAALGKMGMRITLEGRSGRGAGDVPFFSALLAPPKEVASAKELVGQTFTNFGMTAPFSIAPAKDVNGFARTATLKITSATDDAVEGTFTGEFYDSPMVDAKFAFKVTDGKFKAYPAQIVTQQMIDNLKRGALPR